MATVGCPFTRLDWSCSLCVIANVLAAIRNSTLLHQAVEVLPHRAEGLPHLLQHRGHEHSLPRTGRRSQAVKPLSFRQWPLVAQAPARANTYLLLLGEPRENLVAVVCQNQTCRRPDVPPHPRNELSVAFLADHLRTRLPKREVPARVQPNVRLAPDICAAPEREPWSNRPTLVDQFARAFESRIQHLAVAFLRLRYRKHLHT